MAEVGRAPGDDDGPREGRATNWPLWLLVPLGIFGLVAVSQLDERRSDTVFLGRPGATRVVFQGRPFSGVGAAEAAYPDHQMVQVGRTDLGIALYRHRAQPRLGGGGGGGGEGQVGRRGPIYMRVGHDRYLPLAPIEGERRAAP